MGAPTSVSEHGLLFCASVFERHYVLPRCIYQLGCSGGHGLAIALNRAKKKKKRSQGFWDARGGNSLGSVLNGFPKGGACFTCGGVFRSRILVEGNLRVEIAIMQIYGSVHVRDGVWFQIREEGILSAYQD